MTRTHIPNTTNMLFVGIYYYTVISQSSVYNFNSTNTPKRRNVKFNGEYIKYYDIFYY